MRRIGIVGGMAPESTVEYYRLLVAAYQAARPDGSYPPIVINSIDLTKMLDLVARREFSSLVVFLLEEVQRLADAGAELGLLASNTPHIVFDEINRQSPIPLVSLVEAACGAVKGLGLKKVGLFGTRSTMQADFYPKVFSRAGIAISLPTEEEQEFINQKYLGEIVRGIFLPPTRKKLLAIAEAMKKREQIEGLILGGTELPLCLRKDSHQGIPLLDTAKLHVQAVITAALE